MLSAPSELVIGSTPQAHFGAGSIAKLPGIVAACGGEAVLLVTDALLARTPVIGAVSGVLTAAGLPVTVVSGVQQNPTTADLAAGAVVAGDGSAGEGVAAGSGERRLVVVAVGGGSPIDAAKGIALAAVNPERGRELDYRSEFAADALDDEVLANAPVQPTERDISSMLAAALAKPVGG